MNRNTTHDLGLLALRSMLASVFLFHGSQKVLGLFGGHGLAGMAGFLESLGVPFPMLSATLAGSTELLGGLALLSGFGMRTISVPLTFTMLVAAFTAHSGFAAQSGGMEYPLTLAVATAALGMTGPGRFALERPRSSAQRSMSAATI